MIVGNPNTFSILTMKIESWNQDDTFCNGLLVLSVDSNLFPGEYRAATLKYEVPELKEKLSRIEIDKEIFNMVKNKAFSVIYNLSYPREYDIENDFRFEISPSVLQDCHCFVFAVSNGEFVRFLAGQLEYIKEESRHNLNDIDVSETFISMVELNEIIAQLEI